MVEAPLLHLLPPHLPPQPPPLKPAPHPASALRAHAPMCRPAATPARTRQPGASAAPGTCRRPANCSKVGRVGRQGGDAMQCKHWISTLPTLCVRRRSPSRPQATAKSPAGAAPAPPWLAAPALTSSRPRARPASSTGSGARVARCGPSPWDGGQHLPGSMCAATSLPAQQFVCLSHHPAAMDVAVLSGSAYWLLPNHLRALLVLNKTRETRPPGMLSRNPFEFCCIS